ncbi:TetR/AcrR family transcriptional regulator [Streptomyces sp. NPDC014894]|uniref:TetR/AcrR family transcriptional regulator n=1 Tax=unclassified Streptomyces TaxID=2593676 RepID=UPI0036FB8F28
MARPRKFDETHAVGSAMEAFWRQGYRATSTRDLSDCTGIGPSSLYNAFGDKRQLYLRTLRQYYSTNTVAQTEVLRAEGPAKSRIRELMVHSIDIDLSGKGPAGCFAINALIEMGDEDPEVNDELMRHFGAVEEALRETIAQGQRAGEIDPGGDARILARQVLSTYYGLRVLARIQKDRKALMDVVESALAAL